MPAVPASLATPPKHRSRFVATALGVVLLAVVAGCMPAEEQTFFDRTNRLRARQGIPALVEHTALVDKAEAWAHTMAASGHLRHSTLRDGLDALAWKLLGENIGYTSNTTDPYLALHQALVSSPPHYENKMNPRFTHMGVGVATSADGRVWVVEMYAQL